MEFQEKEIENLNLKSENSELKKENRTLRAELEKAKSRSALLNRKLRQSVYNQG